MGLTKRYLEEIQARGYVGPSEEVNVCSHHFEDDFVIEVIRDSAEPGVQCDLCKDGSGRDAAPLFVLLDLISDALSRHWERANDAGVPWDKGWVFPTQHTDEIVDELLYEMGADGRLAEVVSGEFEPDDWVSALGPRLPDQRIMMDNWREFCEYVKHQSRFLLKRPEWHEPAEGIVDPSQMLSSLKPLVERLLVTIESGTLVYRARSVDAAHHGLVAPKDYTSPPSKRASQGRMNPAGVAVFYGAFSAETAAIEVYNGLPFASVAEFRTLTPLTVVDLTTRDRPSLLDPDVDARRAANAAFMHMFATAISAPIVHDDRVHHEYAPTQAFTEYLRYRLLPADIGELDGIVFPSSVSDRGRNIVIFTGQDGCLTDDQLEVENRRQSQVLMWSDTDPSVFRFFPPKAQLLKYMHAAPMA